MKLNKHIGHFFINSIFLTLFFSSFSASFGQTVSSNWEQELSQSLEAFINCESSENNKQCYKYLGQSVNTVYKVNDFYSKESGRYMLPNEIADFVSNGSKWELLGPAYDKNALDKAQSYANSKKATIAVYKAADGQGHVALILPGDLQASGSWGIKVPNSASFFLSDHQKSYVGKGLSYAFTKDMLKDVVVYGRKY
ncbi:hypothetical protein GCM10009122_47900 [Fulvivirga kasyanovii]|uniref:Peptidase C39-like domain-containing protein n=1 Tax=Fulvivirga kasyanovii TaxID=396812 RepID=A0ABW9RI77_9BACT|nr:hypothetical protein [Fulvivirga kasyanovii]MTI23768.1 hypothetical protein [Fulvivirga kasyanovii]